MLPAGPFYRILERRQASVAYFTSEANFLVRNVGPKRAKT